MPINMWHIDAEIIALCFTIPILVDIFKTVAHQSLKDKLFKVLAVSTVAVIIIDILSSWAMLEYATLGWWTIEISLMLYFILTPMLSLLWYLYSIAVLFKTSERRTRICIISTIPFLLYVICIILNPITEWQFSLSDANIYARGAIYESTFIIYYGYSMASFVFAFLTFKKTERTTSIILLMFPVFAGISVLLQSFLEGYLLTGAAFTMVLLITYMFLQNKKMTRDTLTGLNNRYAFTDAIDRLTKSNDRGYVLAVAIDDFKLFNQTFGQQTGDSLLCSIGEYIVDITKDKTCYRYGGDIFTIILKKSDEKGALAVADTILSKFSKSFYMDSVGYSVSVSIGIVEYPQKAENRNHSVITAIDFAIYQAKRRGKGQSALYSSELIRQLERKYEVMDAISRALENDSFEVYIQPIFHIERKSFVFAEALLRLFDGKLGFISPAELVPIAEETGQIVEITYRVLDSVCAFIAKNRSTLRDEVSISVNFSVIQFMQTDMVDRVKNIIEGYRIPPNLIKIEVTESVIAESFEDIKMAMTQLNDYGISFALDDYGQGYSNINYLINLPFSFVKLDKGIIDNIMLDSKFICALVPMFKSLDKILVAEGVEVKGQLDILNELSCDSIQGYYFAKPMKMVDVILFFDEHNNKATLPIFD